VDRLPPMILAAMTVALPVGACSSQDTPEAPPGYVGYRGDGYTFARPTGWQETRTSDEAGAPMVEFHGAPDAQGAFRGQLIMARRDHFSGTMADQLAQVRMLNNVNGRRILADGPVKVPGAREGRWIEAAYDDSSSGAAVRVRIVDVYAFSPKGTMFDLVARAQESEFERTGLRQALDTFRVG
jgi:hypothetical protein